MWSSHPWMLVGEEGRDMGPDISLGAILLGLLFVLGALVIVRSFRMSAGFVKNQQRRDELRKERLDRELADAEVGGEEDSTEGEEEE